MGSFYSTNSGDDAHERHIWPIRYFHQLYPGIDIEDTRFALWDPRKYRDLFAYPAKEPAKDF